MFGGRRHMDRRAWWYYRDHCGTLRVGGKPGRRMRRMLRKKGALVRMRLAITTWRIAIVLHHSFPQEFPHVVPPRIFRQQQQNGYDYHITVTLRRVKTCPALRAVSRINNWFKGKGITVRLPISYVSPGSHGALTPWNGSPLSEIYGDLLFLCAQYGRHPGNTVGISM